MTKTSKIHLLILRFFGGVLCCGLICSCTKNKNLEGTWVYAYNVLEFSNNTVSFLPSGDSFAYMIENGEINLTKRLGNIKNGRFDSISLPIPLGIISNNENSFSSKLFAIDNQAQFIKLEKNNGTEELEKIQFTMHNGWDWGCNYEIDINGKCTYEIEGYDFVSNTYTFELEEIEFNEFKKLLSLIDLDSIQSNYIYGGCSDVPGYSFSFISRKDTLNTFIYCSLEHHSLLPLRYFLEGRAYRNSLDSLQHNKIDKKIFNSKIVECHSDSICMIDYMRRFDTLQYHLPKHDKALLRKLFDKYYLFDDDNICYRIRSDEKGSVKTFEFYDKRIEPKSDFLDELKSTLRVNPAVFQGKRVAIEDFECISYISD